MKRVFALFLALSFLVPACLSFSAHSATKAGHGSETQAIAAVHETHCPSDMPEAPDCSSAAQPILTFEQIAPRPDTAGLFGAAPAPATSASQLPRSQDSPSPDLQQLSITRV